MTQFSYSQEYAELSKYYNLDTDNLKSLVIVGNLGSTTKYNTENKVYYLVDYYINSDNGYAGYAFQEDGTDNIIVVHAGSANVDWSSFETPSQVYDFYNDWIKTNIGGLGTGTIPSQFESADFFMTKMNNYCKSNNLELSSIGQSLGGSLNQGLGMLDKYKDIEFINYNPFGMKHLSNKLVEKGYQLSNDYSNITNLIAQNELLSKFFEQAGNTYVATTGDTGNLIENHYVDVHIVEKRDYTKVDQPNNIESWIKNTVNNVTDCAISAIDTAKALTAFDVKISFTVNIDANLNTAQKIALLNSYPDIGIPVGKVIAGNCSISIKSSLELENFAGKFNMTLEQLRSANLWIETTTSANGKYTYIEDTQQLYIPENILRGSATYNESFETVRDIYTGEKSPSDLINYEIPEDSEFYVPQGGDPQQITYQYTQAPIVDRVTQLIQTIAIVNAMTGNAALVYFMRPDLFPQITAVLSAMSTVMHIPQQNFVQSGNFANSVFDLLVSLETHAQLSLSNPLSLDLDGDGIETISLNNSNIYFDNDNDGFKEKTGWLKGDDGLLVIDKNNNGKIDNQSELFGSDTTKGFEDLRVYDTNNDGIIDTNDTQFNDLKVWQDVNENGITDEGELHSLNSKGITSINLNYNEINVIQNGNKIAQESTYTKSDGTTGGIYDVLFAYDGMKSIYGGEYKLNIDTLELPWLRGYGNVMDLQLAASQNSELLELIKDMSNMTSAVEVFNNFDELLAKWTGSSASKTEMQGAVSKQQVQILEKFLGINITGEIADNVKANYIAAYEQIKNKAFVEFIAQTSIADDFEINFDYKNNALVYNDNTYQKIVENLTNSDSFIVSYMLSKELAMTNSLDVNKLVGIITDLGYGASLISYINSGLQFTLNGEIHYDEPQLPMYVIGSDGNDTIQGTNSADIIYGMDANDLISGGAGDDFLYGGLGNDTLIGAEGNDTLVGGEGDDTLEGGGGDDTYIYEQGNDTILDESWVVVRRQEWYQEGAFPFNFWKSRWVESKTLADGGNDTVIFDKDIDPLEVSFARSGNDLIIEKSSGNKLTIKNWYTSTEQRIEKFIFSKNGLSFSAEHLLNLQVTDSSSTIYGDVLSNLIITSGNTNTVINPGKGDDVIIDKGTNTTYKINLDDGYKTIIDCNGNDTIEFGEGINKDNIKYSRNGLDLVIIHEGSDNTVHIINWFDKGNNRIETFKFSDGSTYSYNQLLQGLSANNPSNNDDIIVADDTQSGIIVDALGGNDLILGTTGNDTIDGGAGRDIMKGGAGNDVYYVDNIYDKVAENENEGIDTVYSSVTHTLQDNVENLVLSGSKSINGYGNDLNNTITGNSGNNILNGVIGYNTLIGGLGDDTYIINPQYDTVIENENGGNDTIISKGSYTLGNNIENLILNYKDDESTYTGTGNSLDNYICGVAGESSTLIGGDGNDTLHGGYYTTLVDEPEHPDLEPGTGTGEGTGTGTGTGEGEDEGGETGVGEPDHPGLQSLNPNNTTNNNPPVVPSPDDSFDPWVDNNDPPTTQEPTDIMEGGSGNDTYVFAQGCKDTIIRETSGEDVILLSETRNSNNVVFYQNDNNLVINYGIVHDDGTIIVEDYFLNNGYKIEKIQLSNNEYLESSEIDSIIQNMNAYAAENDIQISSANDITNNDELMQLVTSGWQS